MQLPKMSKTKMVALVAIAAWPIAYLMGIRGGMYDVLAGGAVFMWIFQVLGDAPVTDKKKRNLGFRQH